MPQAVYEAPLNISVDSDGDRPRVSVSGSADERNICHFISIIHWLCSEHHGCIDLDLEQVQAVDIIAMKQLASTAQELAQCGIRLRLVAASAVFQSSVKKMALGELFCDGNCTANTDSRSCPFTASQVKLDIFSMPCSMDYGKIARNRVGSVAESAGFDKCNKNDVLLAVGEAVTNAIRYGYNSAEESYFTVSCLATGSKLCVSIMDSGPGFDPSDIPSFEDALFMEHGRGIHCMRSVMDEVDFHFDCGTTVSMTKNSF